MEYVQVSLELSLSSLDYGKQAVIDDGKENCKGGESNEIENNGCCLTFDVWKRSSSELLVGESRSHADQYQRESLKHNNNAAGLSGTVSLQLSLGTTAKKRERMEKPSCGSSTTTRKLVTEDDNIIKENSQGAGDDVVSSYNATTSTTTAATSTAIDRDKGKKVLLFDDYNAPDHPRVSKKRERMEKPITRKVRSTSNKRSKFVENGGDDHQAAVHDVMMMRPATEHTNYDHWCIKKKLFASDIGNNTRLLLPSQVVEDHVFKQWSDDQRSRIKASGLLFSVWDCDTNTQHELLFKQWSNGAYVLINNWMKEFVKRRQLKVDDEVGLYLDISTSTIKFSVLNRAAAQGIN